MSTGAVVSAREDVLQQFSKAIIDGLQVQNVLVDVSLFSMLSTALYIRLVNRPHIQKYKNSSLDIVKVGNANAADQGNIDDTLQIARPKVNYLLLIVKDFSILLLIGTDVLCVHVAILTFGNENLLRFGVLKCRVYLKLRGKIKRVFKSFYCCVYCRCVIQYDRI